MQENVLCDFVTTRGRPRAHTLPRAPMLFYFSCLLLPLLLPPSPPLRLGPSLRFVVFVFYLADFGLHRAFPL